MSEDRMNTTVHVATSYDGAAIDAMMKKLIQAEKLIDRINKSGFGSTSKRIAESLGADRNAASDFVRRQRDEMTALRQRFSFESRMRRQKQAEERSAERETKAAAADEMKQVRETMAVRIAMNRQRSREEKAVAAESARSAREQAKAAADAERAEARAYRSSLAAVRATMSVRSSMDRQRRQEEAAAEAAANRAENARTKAAREAARQEEAAARRSAAAWDRAYADMGRGLSRGRQAYGQAVSGARAVVAGAGGFGAGIAAGGIRSRMSVDAAETNLKIFGDNGGKKFTQKDIQQLRADWLDNSAFATGNSVTDALKAFTEINKAGIKNPKENTDLLLKATSALELDVPGTTKLMGLIDRNLGARSTPARMKSALNAIAVAAREDPTQAPEIVEGMKRGFGALSMGNMSVEDLAMFVSGGQSVGIQPGKAGTFVSSLMKDLSAGGYARGQRGKDLNKATSMLGFGNARNMARMASGDSTNTIFKVMESLSRMSEEQRAKATHLLSQTQWSDEDLQMLQGLGGMKHTRAEIKDSKNANFIEDASAERMQAWDKQWARTKAIFSRFWESIGAGFDDIYRTVNSYFYESAVKFNWGSVTTHVKGFLDGFINGLGFKDIRALLESAFGKPGEQGRSAVEQFKSFGVGLGQGLRSIFDAVKNLMLAFTGGQSDPETIGRLTGKIIGLSGALLLIAPVVGVLGALGTAIGAFSAIVAAAAGTLRAAGLMGATTAGKAAEAGVLGRAASGLGRLVPAFAAPLTMDPSKADRDKLDRRLGTWAIEQERNRKALEGNTDAIIQKQSYEGGGFRSLLHRTSLDGDVSAVIRKAVSSGEIARAAGTGQVGSVMGAAGVPYTPGAGGSALYGNTPGKAFSTPGVGPRYGVGPSVPGVGGSATGIPDSVPMTPDERNKLGLIMKYESGGRNVMNGVGARMGLDPMTPKGYTAQGYFQMLNSNWRRIAPKLGIKAPNAMSASLEDQTRVALHLLRNGGIQNWSNYNPKLRAALARGEQAPSRGVPNIGGSGTASIGPSLPEGALGSGSGRSRGHIDGQIDFEGEKYDFGSGGHKGANSIPAGTYPITPDAIGPWGRAHGAIGINGNRIWDSTLGRYREGIEFHAASSASKLSAGCIAIARGQYAKFRAHVLDVIRRQGSAYLTVGEDGRAQIVGGKPKALANGAGKALGEGIIGKGGDDATSEDIHGSATAETLSKELKHEKLAREAPSRSGGGVRGGGSQVHAPINIHTQGQDPETTAAAVQRHLKNVDRYSTHDSSFESI